MYHPHLARRRALSDVARRFWNVPSGDAVLIVMALYWRFASDGARRERGSPDFPFFYAAEEIAVVVDRAGGDPKPTEFILAQLIAAVKAGANSLPANIAEAIAMQFPAGQGGANHG